MTLHNRGKRRRWGYAWVFLATPIVALPLILLSSLGIGFDLPYWAMADPKSAAILALTVPMVITYMIVRIHYWRQDARMAESMQNRIQNSENVR